MVVVNQDFKGALLPASDPVFEPGQKQKLAETEPYAKWLKEEAIATTSG